MVEYNKTKWDEEFAASVVANQQSVQEQNRQNPESDFFERERTRKSWGFKRILALVLVATLALGSSIGFGFRFAGLGDTEPQQTQPGQYYIQSETLQQVDYKADVANDIPDIVARLEPSIVAITNQQIINSFFYGEINRPASGTGVVFNISADDVLIVTNNHVVENSQGLTVAFDDEHTAEAELLGADVDADIAIIKVKKADIDNAILKDLKPVVFGNSAELRAGELAIAIGNPLGYTDTVTVGFISGVNRKFQMSSGAYMSLIQTDAAINPGNSGGALLNGRGEVIGINTVKIAETSVEGIGFAIPINEVKPIIEQILENGHVSKPYLGIYGEDVPKDIAKLYNVKEGVVIREVERDSGADQAGLQTGDIITAVDDQTPVTFEDIVFAIKAKKVGDSLKITYYREGKSIDVEVILKERKAD